MKKYLVILACLMLLAPVAFGEVLTGAIPNSPGAWTFALFTARQSNVGNIGSLYQSLNGMSVGYGLVDKLQANLVYENGVFGGIPGYDMTMNSYTLAFVYNLIMESGAFPVSVAINPSVSLLSQSDSTSGSSYSLGIVASKMIGKFMPYLSLAYADTNLGGESSEVDLTAGGTWLATDHIAVVAENTWQFENGYTTGRWSLCLAYSL